MSRPRYVAQALAAPGGWRDGPWLTDVEIKGAEERWTKRSYAPDASEADGEIRLQCGGCRYFAAFGADFGVCCNGVSRFDGLIVFEHGGCLNHSERK